MKKKDRELLILPLAWALIMAIACVAHSQTRTVTPTLTWNDNSNNEDGFKLYRKNADATFSLIGQVGANSKTFTAPPITANEGAQLCFGASAFNVVGESAKAEGCMTVAVTAIAALPIALESTTMPEYKATEITLTKPAGATKAVLSLDVYDADFPNEGELFINGNGPVILFGPLGVTANADKVATVEFDLPLAWLTSGANKLRFSHLATNGYRINAAAVRFETNVPAAPQSLTVSAQ